VLQKLNKILSRNNRGFTLIELMVAVAILALVAIGLFQAFTAAFQSMNDSRDRTVATNYAQQILEDYKNTSFKDIRPLSEEIEGTKFSQNVSLQKISDDLINVFVQITWNDRNGSNKSITAETKIYDTQSIAAAGTTPAGIVIYADRYNLLPGTDNRAVPSHIYAEIIDKNGDIIIDWKDSNVEFNIESVIDFNGEAVEDIFYLGNLRDFSVNPVNGVADTYFDQYTGEEREGFVKINATLKVGEIELYDVLNLKVTNDAVAIVLESDKDIVSTEGGVEGIATLTATIVDAVGDVVETGREISFNIFSGPGSLSDFVPNNGDGIATISLIAGDTPGTAVIIATSSSLLEPGAVGIKIVNPGMNDIFVEAAYQSIVQQGSTEIIAYLTNYLGEPVSGETINFETDLGSLSDENTTTDVNGEAGTTLTMNYAGSTTVIASWEAADGTIVSDTVSVLCRNHNLYVTADPLTIAEGGTTTITAELTNAAGNSVVGENINFSIIEGNGTLLNYSDITNESGEASDTLTIYSEGIVVVEANWQGDPTVVLNDVEVICTASPIYVVEIDDSINTTISVGESIDIKVTVTENGNPVSDVEVEFSLDNYNNAKLDDLASSVIKTTDENGEATVELSGLAAGDSVTVTADAGGDTDSINISCEAPEIIIELADPSNIEYLQYYQGNHWRTDYKIVIFNIIIRNGNINLNKMKISWETGSDEKLSSINIDNNTVYSNNSGAENGTILSFNVNPFYYYLSSDNTYTIEMEFKSDVEGKDWTITFINPDTDTEISPPVTFDADDFN